MPKKYSQLQIIVRGNDIEDQDNYDNLRWDDFGEYPLRETRDGRKVRYQYHHSHNPIRRDVARAVVIGPRGIEAKAYLQDAYSEDFELQTKLNRMLRIKLKK